MPGGNSIFLIEGVIVQILGSGCANCKRLTRSVEAAANELGIEYSIEKVTEPEAIARSGVMKTPALIVNGELILYGRIPGIEELKLILTDAPIRNSR